MTNALIEKLEEISSRYHNEVVVEEDIIDDCIDIVKQHSDWVNVSERLPNDKVKCLCVMNGEVKIAQYAPRINEWRYDNEFHRAFILGLTHWQPLPQPPSEVQSD